MATLHTPFDYQPELTVLSFGAGQDSTAILYMLVFNETFRKLYAPNRLLVLFSDTGDEHPETYEHIEDVRRFCEERRIEFETITPDLGFHRGHWQTLLTYFRAYDLVMTKVFNKSCTDQLKIQPLYRYLNAWIADRYGYPWEGGKYREKRAIVEFARDHGKIRMLIGIAKGEESRVGSDEAVYTEWMRLSVQREYPLLWLQWDRLACQEYIARQGKTVPPPSNCIHCPFMDKVELLWMARSFPDHFKEWVRLERRKLKKFAHLGERNVGVFGGLKPLPVVLAEAEKKHGHMTLAELTAYRNSHGHCVKSRY